jgi:hypothetical protein
LCLGSMIVDGSTRAITGVYPSLTSRLVCCGGAGVISECN